jgi:hypothetical protein
MKEGCSNESAIAKIPHSGFFATCFYLQGLLVFLYGIWISISELNADFAGQYQDYWDTAWALILRPLFPFYFIPFALVSIFVGSSLRTGRRAGFCRFFARFQCFWTIPGFLNAAELLVLQQERAFDPPWKTELGLAVSFFVLILGILGARAMGSAGLGNRTGRRV